MGDTYSKEGAFIVRCLQAWHRGTAVPADERPETDSLEWDRVLELTRRHSVGPQVAAALRETTAAQALSVGTQEASTAPPESTDTKTESTIAPQTEDSTAVVDSVPAHVSERLRERSAFVARRNLQQFHELASLSATFQATGIRAIPYRGPVMAQLGYGDVGQREFGDLDLLVDREDIPVIKSILLERGYEPAYVLDSTDELTVSQERCYRRLGREYTFKHTESGIEVELHWRVLARRFPTGFDLESCGTDARN